MNFATARQRELFNRFPFQAAYLAVFMVDNQNNFDTGCAKLTYCIIKQKKELPSNSGINI